MCQTKTNHCDEIGNDENINVSENNIYFRKTHRRIEEPRSNNNNNQIMEFHETITNTKETRI